MVSQFIAFIFAVGPFPGVENIVVSVGGDLDGDRVEDVAEIWQRPTKTTCQKYFLVVRTSREKRVHSGQNVFSRSCTSLPTVKIRDGTLLVVNDDEVSGVETTGFFRYSKSSRSIRLTAVEKRVFSSGDDADSVDRSVSLNLLKHRITTTYTSSGRREVARVKIAGKPLEQIDEIVDFNPDIFPLGVDDSLP